MRRARALAAAVVGGALCALAAPAAPAAAATAASANACQYSINGNYAQMPISVTTTASVVPDALYPSPTRVVPGQTVRTAAGTFDIQLPDYLARFGYGLGLLKPGPNTINAKVWIAIRATNTAERVRVVGPIDVAATTVIEADTIEGAFISATPFSYTAPALPELDWTAVGGDVAVSQAGEGALGTLPVGPGGAARATGGSAVIQLTFPQVPQASLVLDCRPGTVTEIAYDFMGPRYNPGAAAVADVVAGPQNLVCLDELGRLRSGADVNFPAGQTRELDPIAASLAGSAPAAFTPGVPFALTGARAAVTISGDTIATLGREPGLVAPDATYPLTAWVTIAASNTAEGARTVRVEGSYRPTGPNGAPAPWSPADVVLALPDTTWTPTGAGPVSFTIGPPGSMGPIEVTGSATGEPGDPVVATTYAASPYGGLVLRLGTERNGVTLDCIGGATRIANAAVPWSNLGRGAPPGGSAGRYAIVAHPDPAPFAVVAPPAPAGPPVGPPTEQPIAKPAPRVRPGKVVSSVLRVKKGRRLAVTLTCAGQTVTCRGTLSIRTAAKVRIGRRARVVALTKKLRYAIPARKRKTVSIALNANARTLLRTRARLAARVVLTPARGAAVTRKVTIRR
ncbi:MAG: hypothetical protein AB7V42_08970 [Thermoleophilia bacterium]